MTHLFVYGTLKRGCKNHPHLAGQTYIGEARTGGGYQLYHLGEYPGMVTQASDTQGVTGEVWWVDDAALTHLDDFEGVAEGLYRRERVALLAPFDRLVVDTYLYARESGVRLIGTTWVEK